jgi:hypothetical protein
MNLKTIKDKINVALDKLYEKDIFLFKSNLCERCINHKFAIYLEQQNFGDEYFVDCEYNKSYGDDGHQTKMVSSSVCNYIDIVITKRDGNPDNDLICFEIKKWNNGDISNEKSLDIEKLVILTGGKPSINNRLFNYKYGFYIIFGETRDKTLINIYKKGKLVT